MKKGITDPLLPATFPYLTTENIVPYSPEYALAEINNLSDTNFVPPYKFIGLTALSVDSATTFFTFLSIAASIIFSAP